MPRSHSASTTTPWLHRHDRRLPVRLIATRRSRRGEPIRGAKDWLVHRVPTSRTHRDGATRGRGERRGSRDRATASIDRLAGLRWQRCWQLRAQRNQRRGHAADDDPAGANHGRFRLRHLRLRCCHGHGSRDSRDLRSRPAADKRHRRAHRQCRLWPGARPPASNATAHARCVDIHRAGGWGLLVGGRGRSDIATAHRFLARTGITAFPGAWDGLFKVH